MFRNREEAALRLAGQLRRLRLIDPLVLGVPRGGVVVGAVLAEVLGAELDVVLAGKVRAPGRPEWTVGAVAENGFIYLNALAGVLGEKPGEDLGRAYHRQMQELARRRSLLCGRGAALPVAGRSVIIADDGIVTGSTMIAAVETVRAQGPRTLVAAVPVLARQRVEEFRRRCDQLLFLAAPVTVAAIDAFYEDFTPISDEQVVLLLREHAAARAMRAPDRPLRPGPG
jgi:predicted phosphoribosyltransferase